MYVRKKKNSKENKNNIKYKDEVIFRVKKQYVNC